jgi:transposase
MSDFDALSRDELIALAKQLWALKAELESQVAALQAELERLRKDPPSGTARAVPSFVKPNRTPKERKPRKKRPHSYVRLKEEPTRVIEHAAQECPECGRKLSGGWVHGSRQVIEIPVMAYEVIEHRMIRRHCGVCDRDHLSWPDLSCEVTGSHRLGVRLMSLISCMKIVHRMPARTIQKALKATYRLDVSLGEIAEVLHTVAGVGEAEYQSLKEQVRQSRYVHADETGWREDGENGYLWSFSTPDVRYFHRDRSRGHQVPESVLGEAFPGILVSDFYGGYNYHLGLHQRCWVHFLRNLHDLKAAHEGDAEVAAWVGEVVQVYEDAKSFQSEKRRARIRARERFQERLLRLGEPYARTGSKQNVLAERIMRFANELFTFVEHPDVPSHNNAAERAIRPSVIDRKVTGGTRSNRGSQTRSVLMSLFRTWEARGLDLLETCRTMLTHELAPT